MNDAIQTTIAHLEDQIEANHQQNAELEAALIPLRRLAGNGASAPTKRKYTRRAAPTKKGKRASKKTNERAKPAPRSLPDGPKEPP